MDNLDSSKSPSSPPSIFATVITKPDEVSSSSQFSTVIQHISGTDPYSTVVHKAAESFRKDGGGSVQRRDGGGRPRGKSDWAGGIEGSSGALSGDVRDRTSLLQENVAFEDPSLKYELLNELGKGSYGAVYKARDLLTSELVAVKVISLTEGEEGYEEIRGEIGMLQQCNHPNVVRYLGSFQGEDYLWIVMEYCGGGSVADLMNITDEALEEQQIAYICREALKGLTYLHSIFKVHRDIKGGNILLTEQGEVKLGDFGVAAQLTRTMSKRNTFIGTPHWMAPEVIQENRYDGKVDVWALGVSAIEMAEGLPPRSNVHPMRVLFMISREPAPMLEDKERWSLVFHDYVAKCLTKEPRLRPTASALLSHKFIEKCKGTASSMLPQIEKARRIRAEMAAQAANYVQEQGTTSSGGQYGSWEKGQTVKMHDTSAGTMLVRDTVVKSLSDTFKEGTGTIRGPVSAELDSRRSMYEATMSMETSPNREDSKSSLDTRDQDTDQGRNSTPESTVGSRKHFKDGVRLTLETPTTYSSSYAVFSPIPHQPVGVHSSISRRSLSSMEATLGPGTPVGGGNRPGFGIQDKLLSVYAAGNTVPIPFLKATDLSPIALTFDRIFADGRPDRTRNVALEAIQDLYVGEGHVRRGRKAPNSEMPLPPSVYQRTATSTTLPNLARSLAYHKRCYEELPSQGWQAAQEQQIIHNLSDTLRTILRL